MHLPQFNKIRELTDLLEGEWVNRERERERGGLLVLVFINPRNTTRKN
jgi:hypothetical protein